MSWCLTSAPQLTLHINSRPPHQAFCFSAKDTVPVASQLLLVSSHSSGNCLASVCANPLNGSARDALLTDLRQQLAQVNCPWHRILNWLACGAGGWAKPAVEPPRCTAPDAAARLARYEQAGAFLGGITLPMLTASPTAQRLFDLVRGAVPIPNP